MKTFWTIFMILLPLTLQAQGMIVMFIINTRLTDDCDNGTPLPDGTPVLIFHDPTQDGPSEDDFPPSGVNYASFALEGSPPIAPPVWVSVDGVPQPPFFYLMVCGPENHYYSFTFTVTVGYQEIIFTEDSWTCIDEPCDLCLPPPMPTGLEATDFSCAQVILVWTAVVLEESDGYFIYRDDERIFTLDADVLMYVDIPLPGTYVYGVESYRPCPNGDTLVSPRATASGTRLPGPPTPGILEIMDHCHEVMIVYVVTTIIGLDSIRVYRDEILIGQTGPGVAGLPQVYFDHLPPPGPHEYYVVGWSQECGEGPPSDTAVGEAIYPPEPVENLVALMDVCSLACIQWDYFSGPAEEFIITRNNAVIAVVPWVMEHSHYLFCDSSVNPGISYAYRVIASNSCGSGPGSDNVLAVASEDPPPAPENVRATTYLADRITVRWSGAFGVDHYIVIRNGTPYELVEADVREFHDFNVEVGVPTTYQVAAVSGCGEGEWSDEVTGIRRSLSDAGLPFVALTVTDNITGIMDLSYGDFDFDGDVDIVAADMFADDIVTYINDGNLGFTAHVINDDLNGARAVEFSQHPELILTSGRFDNVLLAYHWNGDENSWSEDLIEDEIHGLCSVSFGDLYQWFNFAAISCETGRLSYWRIGGGFFEEHLIAVVDTGGHDLIAANLDGVQRDDLILSSRSAGTIKWWENDGSGEFTEHLLADNLFHPNAVAAEDMDNDDDLDILCVTSGAGEILWYENNGQGEFVQHLIVSGLNYPRDVAAADVNHDDLMDIIVAVTWGDEISWWRNDGEGGFHRNIISDEFTQARVVEAFDIDDDGDIDIIGGGQEGITIWVNQLFHDGGPTTLSDPKNEETRTLDSEDDPLHLPTDFYLAANYPNPFNPATTIRFGLPREENVTLNVFDVTGRLISTLAEGRYPAGEHTATFNGGNLPSGIYFYQLRAGEFSETRKMILMR